MKEMEQTKKYVEWMCKPPNQILMLIKPIDLLYAEYIKFAPVDVLCLGKKQYIQLMVKTFDLAVILQNDEVYFNKNL